MPFEWSMDMLNRMRIRNGASQPSFKTLVKFPPDQRSKFCNKAIPDTNCNRVTSSIKVGYGKFNIKIRIGDIIGNSRVDILVNNKPFINQVTIEKNKLQTFEGEFNSIDEMIII